MMVMVYVQVDYIKQKKFKMIFVGKLVLCMLEIINIVKKLNVIINKIIFSKKELLNSKVIFFLNLVLLLICVKEHIDKNVMILIVKHFKELNESYQKILHLG